MNQAFRAFIWFVRQCVNVGGLGPLYFWIPFLAGLAALYWTYMRTTLKRWKLAPLAALPAVWILVGLWGGFFWLHWEKVPVLHNPAWVLYPVKASIAVYLFIAAGLIAYLRGARWFAAIFTLINLYFELAMAMLASMAVTGDWL